MGLAGLAMSSHDEEVQTACRSVPGVSTLYHGHPLPIFLARGQNSLCG